MVLITLDVALNGPLRRLDHIVHRFCDAHTQSPVADAVIIGQRADLLAVMVPLAVIAALRTRSWRPLVAATLIVVALSVLQLELKAVIPRTSPFSGRDVIFTYGDAYPSGHTLNGFLLIWVILELAVVAFPRAARAIPTRRRHIIALTTGAITAAAVTLDDQHWLTDALFSVALGPVLLNLLIAADPFQTRPAPSHRADAPDTSPDGSLHIRHPHRDPRRDGFLRAR
ncbi:phosphatase PAP2 family protein [Spirillospora albida]|uniref:phosphatase PAP2 family protein n=1 Tax=Spirillospora albida TaxID=58123 RepID=UPI001B80754A|nr:phosphatase PAP2 family protein [Spirillospora albida]